MKKKAIFLDRDGTINVDKHYLHKISDFEFLPGVIEGLKLLRDAGFLLVIITNQSGIGRGYYSEDDFNELNQWMLHELSDQGIDIAKVYYCPHYPKSERGDYGIICNCRKPQLGLFEKAIKELNIDIQSSYAIGDRIRDCVICEATNCKGYLIGDSECEEVIVSYGTARR